MNHFFRNILAINPDMLNKIPERFINNDDVEAALEKGYKISDQNPTYLLKFKSLAALYFEQYKEDIFNENKILSYQELIYLKELKQYETDILNDKVIKLNNYSKIEQQEIIAFLLPKINDLNFSNIKILVKSNLELTYEFLKKNSDFLNEFIDLPLDYDKVYESIQNSIKKFKYYHMNMSLFDAWYKKDKSILINKNLSDKIYDNPEILKYIESSGYSLEEIANSNLFYSPIILEHYLKQDFSNIEYIKSIIDYDLVISIFFMNLKTNIKHIKKLSTLIPNSALNDSQKKEIINHIINNKLSIDSCDWSFIKQESDVCYLAIMNNPNLLLEWNNFDFSSFKDLSNDEKENIKNLIKTKKIVFTEITEVLKVNNELLIEALKINPFLIDTYKENNYINIEISKLLEFGYSASVNTPKVFFNLYSQNYNYNFLIESLKKDINLIDNPYFYISNSTDKEIENLYDILKSHDYFLTTKSPKSLFENPLLVLDSLKKGIIKIENIANCRFFNYLKNTKELYNYIFSNYDKTIIDDLNFSNDIYECQYNNNVEQLENLSFEEQIYNVLRTDFSKCKKYKDDKILKLEYQKLIYDLYLENYNINKDYYDDCNILRYNPYIALYELFENNKEMQCTELPSELINKFMEDYKKYNITFKGKYLDLFASSDAKKLIKDNPEIINEIKSYKLDLIETIKECIKDGTYTLSEKTSSELAEKIFEFCLQNNIPNIEYLFYEISPKIKEKFIKLAIENKIDFSKINSNIIYELSEREFYEIAQKNINILKFYKNDPTIIRIFFKYEPIADLLKNLKGYYNFRNEYTNEELKEILNQDVLYLLKEDFVSKISLTPEEWKKYHLLLVNKIKEDPYKVLNTHSSKDYKYVIKDGPNSYDKETILYLCDYIPGDIINLFGDNIEFYNKCVEVLKKEPKDLMKKEISKVNDLNIKKKLCDIFFMADEQLKFPNLYTEDELFDIWIRGSQKITDELPVNVYINKKILSHILNKDINNIKELNWPEDFTIISDDIHKYIYNIFKNNQDKFTIYDSKLFFYNPYLRQEFHNNKEYFENNFIINKITEDYYDFKRYKTPEEIDYIEEISLKNDPLSFKYFNYKKKKKLIKDKKIIINEKSYNIIKRTTLISEFLELNFLLLVDYFKTGDFTNIDSNFLTDLALTNNYILTENSPLELKINKEVALNSMNLSLSSIQYASYKMEFTLQEQEKIAQILLENNIYYNENSFLFLSNNINYIIESIKNKPSSINYIHVSSLKLTDISAIIKIMKEHIKNNKYEISLNIPEFLLLDQDIREIYIDKYPSKATRYQDFEIQYKKGSIQESNPYWIINNAINNITDIDKLVFPENLLYPQTLVKQLINKLQKNNYVVSENTPKFLLNNNDFIYYALKNDHGIPRQYIENFITFENMFKYKNIELFKKYIEKGYGIKYEMYYKKLGTEITIDAATKFGFLLNKISINSISSIEDIKEKIYEIIKSENDINILIDYIIKIEYELSDEEIINGIVKKNNYRIQISNNDKLFLYLIKKDPQKVKLYTGTNDMIFEESIKLGYNFTQEDYEISETFKNSEFISKKALELNIENTHLYQGNSESFYEYAINAKGFIPEYQKVKNNKYMRKSLIVIKKGMYEDLNFAFLYTGPSKDFLDIFEIKDKNNKTLEPTQENISKLPFIHSSTELMLKAIDIDYNNIEFYTSDDTFVFKFAISKGYIPTEEILKIKENFSQSSDIIRRAVQEEIDYLIYYTGRIDEMLDMFELKDKNGKKFDARPEKMQKFQGKGIFDNDELMKKAIKQYVENIVFYAGYNEEIFQYAIEKGYVPQKADFEKSDQLKYSNTIFKYIIARKEKDLHTLLSYYSGFDDNLINDIYISLLGNKYEKIIKNDKDKNNYISIWKSFNLQETHCRLLSYMTPSNLLAFEKMPIDYYLVLKYGIQNDKMSEYIKIINEENLDLFTELYNKITNNYIEFNNNAFGVDLFLKIARLLNNYPELSKDIIKNELTDVQIANLIKLINSNQKFTTFSKVEELTDCDKKTKEAITRILDDKNAQAEEVKNEILKYVFDLDLKEFKYILENYINFDTLDKIISKSTKANNELFIEATMLRAMLSMLEETVNATNELDALKRLLNEYLENNQLVDRTRTLFYDLKERIRNIYELDAIVSLTDLSDQTLPKRESKTRPGKEIVELKNSEYVIYAHATNQQNYEEYVNYRFNGRVTICVSPISNLGKKLYSDYGIVLGFTKVPRGGYIGSSNRNMRSNSYVESNDYEIHKDCYYHLEIKDSSSLTPANHPETLLYRDGLIPSCIIIRGEEPTLEEIDAQEKISKAIREKFGYSSDFMIPLVHTQAIGTVSEIIEKDDIKLMEAEEQLEDELFIDEEIGLGEYQTKIEKINEIREQALQLRKKVEKLEIEKKPVYDIIRMKIGGSHDIFKCHLKDREGIFYLKPGYRKDGSAIDPYRSYAMESSYKIQKIVNPEHAVFVQTIKVPLKDLDNDLQGEVLCSAIEVIPNTTSYEGWKTSSKYQELTEKEMDSFMCEFISDYLLFSYDTKAENFLKDKNGRAYGIDKEQALKFIINSKFIKRDSKGMIESYNTDILDSLSFDPNGCGIIYKYIFENVSSARQLITQATYEKALEAIDRIESISEEEYKLIFKNYVDDFSNSSIVINEINTYEKNGSTHEEAIELVKADLYASLLARKNNLRMEFTKYFSTLLSNYYKNKNEEVPEWVTQTKQMNI